MRVLLFGGAGYVGYELTRSFVQNNDDVAVYDLFANGDERSRRKVSELAGVTVYEGTIADELAVRRAVDDFRPDVVYNLAALHYIPYCIEHPDEVFATNYRGLQNIIAAIRSKLEVKFIFASSASVYGSPNEICTLDTPTIPNDIYGASKLAGEHLIQFQLENYVIMRLFNVYGDLDPHPHLIPKVSRAAVRNETLELGTATAERDFVHVSDVAAAFYAARTAPAGEKYIIATGETHSVREVVDRIYSLAGSQGKVLYETATNMRAQDASYLSGDASKLRLLGWAPTIRFEDGLLSAIEAARQDLLTPEKIHEA
jgi:UDP-glucose 4-epimerase